MKWGARAHHLLQDIDVLHLHDALVLVYDGDVDYSEKVDYLIKEMEEVQNTYP